MEILEHRTFRQKYPSIIPAGLAGICFLLPILPFLALLPPVVIAGSGDECDARFWPALLTVTAIAIAPWVVSGALERGRPGKPSFALALCMSFWTAAWLQFPALALLLGQRIACHGDGQSIFAVIISAPMTSVLTMVLAIIHDRLRLRYIRTNMYRTGSHGTLPGQDDITDGG